MDIGEHAFFSILVSLEYMPSSGIAGSYGSFGKGNGSPLQYACLGNSTDRGAWRATVHGVPNSRTQLSSWARAPNWSSLSGMAIWTHDRAVQRAPLSRAMLWSWGFTLELPHPDVLKLGDSWLGHSKGDNTVWGNMSPSFDHQGNSVSHPYLETPLRPCRACIQQAYFPQTGCTIGSVPTNTTLLRL